MWVSVFHTWCVSEENILELQLCRLIALFVVTWDSNKRFEQNDQGNTDHIDQARFNCTKKIFAKRVRCISTFRTAFTSHHITSTLRTDIK